MEQKNETSRRRQAAELISAATCDLFASLSSETREGAMASRLQAYRPLANGIEIVLDLLLQEKP